jgi:hypothetical protein
MKKNLCLTVFVILCAISVSILMGAKADAMQPLMAWWSEPSMANLPLPSFDKASQASSSSGIGAQAFSPFAKGGLRGFLDQQASVPMQHMTPAGAYHIQVLRGGTWVEAASLSFNQFLQERGLDLSEYITGEEPAHIRLIQGGGSATHIDAVLLGDVPPAAVEGADDPLALKKASSRDSDVLNAFGKTLEFTFPARDRDRTLSLLARVEPTRVNETPFQFPRHNLFRPISEKSAFLLLSPDTRSRSPLGGSPKSLPES